MVRIVLLEKNRYSPNRLVSALESSLNLQTAFDSDAGVWEGYTIREHTLMVLRQFDTYFAHQPLPQGMSLTHWRSLLALHDVLGKPAALQHGNSDAQHSVLKRRLPSVLKKLGYSQNDIRLAQYIFGNALIGEYLMGKVAVEKVAEHLQRASKACGISANQMFENMILYWMVDAGAYTLDAGGKAALDYYFTFDHDHKIMKIRPPYNTKLQQVKQAI